MHVISILALVLKKTQWWMFHRRLFGLTYSFFVWIRLPLYRLGIARTGSVLAAPSFRFPPSSVFFWFPLSAILFLKYKSVKSGEEVAGEGREIQSVMKNFYVLRYRVYFSTFRLFSMKMSRALPSALRTSGSWWDTSCEVLRPTLGVRRAHKDRIFAVYCLQNVAP